MQSIRFVMLLVFVALSAVASGQDREQGATLRIYRVQETLVRVPELVPGQTPNIDVVVPSLDVRGSEGFANVPAPLVSTLTTTLGITDAGEYAFRLTSDDGSLLFINGERVIVNDGRHGMVAVDSKPIALQSGGQMIEIRHFDHAGGRGILLEWMPPGASEWAAIPRELLSTERDSTRVTSPGFKRIIGAGRPGYGMPFDRVHPSWQVDDIRPSGFQPMVGAMCFDHRGRLIVGTFFPLQRDDVALPDIESKEPDVLVAMTGVTLRDNPDADTSKVSIEIVAEGLYEPTGLCAIGDDLYVAHRRAVTKLSDLDGDGFYETHEDVGSGWEGWNYHQFTFDLEHIDRDGEGPHPGFFYTALSTAMAPPKWEGMGTNAAPNGPMRGGVIEIDLATNDTRVIAGGTRTPNGLGLGPEVDGVASLFYADNQGTWMPTSQFSEIVPGRFYGHFNRTNLVPNLADRYPDGGSASVFSGRPRAAPALYLPQNEVSNSPTESLLIEDGPFAGQMLLGELTAGGLRRVFLERVNGQWQGALFRHTQGLEVGVNRIVRGPDGEIFIGGIGGNGNWNWQDTRFGFQRLRPTGDDAFEFHSIIATPDGFELRFTRPVDAAWLADASHYEITQWGYTPTAEYGGAKQRVTDLTVRAAEPISDSPFPAAVRLVVDGLQPDSCVHIRSDPESLEGEQMLSPEAWYTLVAIPTATEARVSVEAVQRDIESTGVGVGVPPPHDATRLVTRSSKPVWRNKAKHRGGDLGSRTQDDLLAAADHIEISGGDIATTTSFADARIHIEWYAPAGGDGQLAGNSGVYLQDLYEIQVLGTLPGSDQLAVNEAGAIYNTRPADGNASTGPGTWQAYDIWFTAARFEGDRRISEARVTVLWNGQLIHDDVPLPSPTGSRNKPGAEAASLATLSNGDLAAIGPLLLQDHASNAEGPVRFRNVWIRSLQPAAYLPSSAPIDGLNGSLDAWTVVGGDASYKIEQTDTGPAIVGTSASNSPNTFLVTKREYADFDLTLEVKQDVRLNSGIQIRSAVDGGITNRRGRLRGPQVELDPTARAYSGGIYGEGLSMGWIYPLSDDPHARASMKPGEWNRIRILAEGPRVRTWVNGIPAADVFGDIHRTGHIALQVHSVGDRTEPMRVRWRNITLRELHQHETKPND
ncbi:MAG: family 16 glycoside hydrolase [Planctomycetota bacterium]